MALPQSALSELLEAFPAIKDRVSERNGHRPRVLTAKAGNVERRIPRLREGSFSRIILEPRRRIDQVLQTS